MALMGPDVEMLLQSTLTTNDEAGRVLKLKEILVAARQAWTTGSDQLNLLAEKLGDESRDGEAGFPQRRTSFC